jgi:hypothetical protein
MIFKVGEKYSQRDSWPEVREQHGELQILDRSQEV